MEKEIIFIAAVCHEAKCAWEKSNGMSHSKSWSESSLYEQQDTVSQVVFWLNNPTAPAYARHADYIAEENVKGWSYGEFNHEKKTSPRLAPFSDMNEFYQKKERLFRAIVRSLR